MHSIKIAISLLVFITVLLFGRADGQSYYFNHFQVENGLSNNSVECSIQDSDGFLWFGTINGLNRFDGYTFKTFYHDAGDSTSIGSNFIRCLYNDSRGIIWVGTNNGVYTFDKLREQFKLVRTLPKGNSTEIICDGRGCFWFIIDQLVYRLEAETGKVTFYPMAGQAPVAMSIAITPDDALWVSTSTGCIRKYVPGPDSFYTYSIYQKGRLSTSIEKIYPMSDSTFLIGTKNEGVKVLDTKTGKYRDIITLNEEGTGIYVRTFIKRNENEYWIGTETGIYIYNSSIGSVTHLQREYDNPYSISDNVVFAFCRDREGGLWVGTYLGGLNYLPEKFVFFEKFFPRLRWPSLSGNGVHEICKDRFGNFWIGTEDAGVDKVNLQEGTFACFKPGPSKGSIAYHNIHGLLATGNELWIGTFEHGLDVLDITTGKVVRHYNAGPGEHSLKNNFIVTIFQTRAHEIFIGTWGGLYKYNKDTGDFTPEPALGLHIQALLEDEQGILWCCTQGEGVYYYDPRTGQYGNFRYDPNDTNSLGDNHVNSIFQDGRNNLWFATEGGLCQYQKQSRKFTRYTTKNGLPDNLIFRIVEDGKNNLWISTSKGLVCFNPDTRDIRTYKRSDGLLSDQFNYNSSFKDVDGTIYFGSVKGLIGFNPAQFRKDTFVPPVYITGIQVNNKEYTVRDKKLPLKEAITYARAIGLPFDESTISIDFAALSYTGPEMNEYAYMLQGFDKDWTYLKTNRKAYFTKLPPGKYIFKVKGSNSSGIWNEKEAELAIEILPPYWASTKAYALYAFVGVLLVCLIIRYYVVRAGERNRRMLELLEREKEREIYHAKIEFFTNIAHEIRTPLTLIKMPLDKLMKKRSQCPEINENLCTMERNTNRLIDLTNQLLDFRKTETDKFSLNFVKTDISGLISETFANFQLAAEEKSISFRLEMPRLTLQAFVDPEAVRKILNNLINNAIKYAGSKVFVQLLAFNSEDNVFSIEVRNDGLLIPYDQKEKIFQPFYRLKATEKQPGSGIGLPLARSLAELHKGILDLKKPENDLNIFLLVLPIHQDKEFVLQNDEAATILPNGRPEEGPDPSRPVILFVEDNKEILDFVSRELQCQYTVRQALNGKQALEVLSDENVQLIISDIMMPVMDGIELCKALKTDLDYSHIPIILLTAKNTLHAKIEGLEVGADAYLEKPFDLEHLKAQISNLLSNRAKMMEYFASSPLVHIKSMGHSKADKQFLERLDTMIQQNLTNMESDVENLARLMNMSRATFHRKVKALSNLTPHELINISRLQKAARLLAEGDYKVYEVADFVGYTLASNFARDFHKQFGMTPSEYVNTKKNQI
ncbi:hybrid sensor histidine kinase/response regulator transcription factor [Puia dinghuensis]|nr:two-component regulator propeller domain-containing protein [Puia dinghuensis]